MSERVTVSPESVRGLGDIVSPKTSEDFITYRSALTETNGVYTITYETKSVTLTVDSASIEYGESVVLTATVIDEGEPAVGETVTFYKGTTEIGTDTTDSEGKATYTVTGLNIGNHSFKAEYDIYTSNTVNVTVNKITSTISLSADHSTITYGSNVVLSGVLSVGSGLTVKLYENNVYVKDLTTSTGGAFSETVSTPSAGSHNFRVEYAGDTEYTSASASVTVTVNKIPTTVTLSTDKAVVNYSELFTLSGQVSVPEIAQLIILKNNQNYETISCDSNGDFSGTYMAFDGGADEYIVTYGGTSIYASSASAPVTVTTVDDLLLEFTGNHFTTGQNTPFEYTGTVIIDWGDNTTETYTGGALSHTYSSSGDYSIKIQGEINAIKSAGFYGCDGLTKVTVPASVTSMEGYCFSDCDDLTEIELRWFGWGSISPIPSYVSSWILNSSSFNHFLIPQDTTSSYTAKGYPSNLLKEKGATPVPDSIDLTGTKSILSYADSESSVLTATVLDENDDPVEGVDVNLYNGSTLWDTLTTDSGGECSKTYSSAGSGDITFTAEVDGTLLTKTYRVEDCWYYNDGTKDDLTYQNGDFGSVVSEGLQLKGTTNSYQKAVMPTSLFSTNDNVSCEIKLGTYTTITPQLALYDSNYTSQGAVAGNTTNNEIVSELSTSSRAVRNSAPAVNEVWKITRENGQSKFYIDDVLLDTVTRSINNFRFGFYTYNNRTEVIKYIKIKPL